MRYLIVIGFIVLKGTGSGLECGIPKPVEWSGSQSVAIGHSPS